jgi:GxxExxY protein
LIQKLANIDLKQKASSILVMNTCFRDVYNALGPGFSESMYHRAIEVYLRMNSIAYESERIVPIVYCNHTIGNVRIDLIVNGDTIIEIKAVARLSDSARIQARTYLNLLGMKQAYLVNFPQVIGKSEPEIELVDVGE